MSSEGGLLRARWPEISSILDRALELSPSERATFLEREIGGDEELRSVVERLLKADAQGSQFLGPSAEHLASSLLRQDSEAVVKRLERFELVAKLGAGGMGEVFEAKDRLLGRKVAIKVLAASHTLDSQGRKRFVREARAASSIDHPNICTVHDIGESDEHLYIVMSLYEGETLEKRLERGPLELNDALSIARQITRGLVCAHDAGIIHRDIKPANILLSSSGQVKILDFGIAKVLNETRLTHTDVTPGTLAYMAPELVDGGEADVRSDLWSVGVLLYQMLSGRLPFERASLAATVSAILEVSAEAISDKTLTPEIEALLEKALEKQPRARFRSAQEFLQALGGDEEVTQPVRGLKQPIRGSEKHPIVSSSKITIVLALIAITLITILLRREPREVLESGGTVTVEVFENLGDATDQKWLGSAMASMLSCDLAQAEKLVVLSGCGLPERSSPTATATTKTSEPPTETFYRVRGNYLANGGRLRLDLWIEGEDGKARRSRILQRDLDEVLDLVEEASLVVQLFFRVATTDSRWLANESITTASIDAWRSYQTGLEAYRDGDIDHAIDALKQSVTKDPEFAMALADLGLLYANRNDAVTARKYFERATNQSHRLPQALRDRVQAELLSANWEGYAASADILERLLEREPSKHTERNHLAAIYGWLERYQDAARLYDKLIDEGTTYYGTYESAASVNVALGRFDQAHKILDEIPAGIAEVQKLRWKRGWVLLEEGRIDAAKTIFEETARSSSGVLFLSRYELWRIAIVEGNWDEAKSLAESIYEGATAETTKAYQAWWGALALARTHLFGGDADQALVALDRATTVYAGTAFAALSLCLSAEVSLALNQPAKARDYAERALELGDQQWPWLHATALLALAYESEGDAFQAGQARDRLAQRALNARNAPELRLTERLQGQLALAQGDYEEAVLSLRKAAKLLPPRGIEFHDHHLPDHVGTWFDLALAEQRAGNTHEARRWFQRIQESEVQMVQAPVAWARSLFYLAEIHQAAGDHSRAIELYSRFLQLRSARGLDEELVGRTEEAMRLLGPSMQTTASRNGSQLCATD